ncbi:MAG: oligosaccharide flippase family protein [Cyanophyceae cyanobacterium]
MKSLWGRLDLSYIYAFLGEATLGLTFVFYILIARTLGPEQYGLFAAATALGGILAFFIQFGLPNLLVREVAAYPQEGPKSTVTFLLLEGLNSLPVLLLLLPLAYALGFEGHGIIVCYLVVLAEVCRSAKQTLRSVLRGLSQFRTETVAVALERSLVVVAAGAALLWTESLIWVVVVLVSVRLLDIFGLLFFVSRRVQIWSPLSFGQLKQALQKAYPFALSGVLWVLYYQVDVLMLKVLATPEEAGFYSASYRLLEIFSALPRVIFYVALTRFTRCHMKNPEQLPQEMGQTTRLLLAVMVPVLLIAEFLQFTLVETVYGSEFFPAIASLSILLPSLSIKIFGNLVGSFLQATGREKHLPRLLLATVIVNVASNFMLIPWLGAAGAALATLLSEVVLAVAGLSLMSNIQYQRLGQRLRQVAAISLITVAMPSLILNGLNPAIGMGIMLAGIAMIVALVRPARLLDKPRTV